MPKEKHSISVLGLVNRPGNYELPADESLRILDALALAGDRQVSVADRVRVIRRKADEQAPVTIQVSIRKAKKDGEENILVAPGDTILVDETPTTFPITTVRGFLRFGFSSAIPGL